MFQNNLLILSAHRTCGSVSLYSDVCNLPFLLLLVGFHQGSSQRLIIRKTRLYCLVFILLASVLSSLFGSYCFHWHTLRHVVGADDREGQLCWCREQRRLSVVGARQATAQALSFCPPAAASTHWPSHTFLRVQHRPEPPGGEQQRQQGLPCRGSGTGR